MFDKMEISKSWLFGFLFACCLPVWAGGHAKSVWMEDLTWVELKARIDAGATSVILPTGGVEQNGPYIALSKHNWMAAHAAQEIASNLGNTLVAPVIKFVPQGDIDRPTGNLLYPGTLALREDTFEQVLSDIVQSLAYAGFQKIYLLGDHGLSQPVQDRVAKRMSEILKKANVKVFHLSAFYQPGLEVAYLESRGIKAEHQGDHAGIADTAQILEVRSDAVRPMGLVKQVDAKHMGMSGSPEKATAKLGAELVRLRLDEVMRQIRGML